MAHMGTMGVRGDPGPEDIGTKSELMSTLATEYSPKKMSTGRMIKEIRF